jgi:signal transduction histidine kinase
MDAHPFPRARYEPLSHRLSANPAWQAAGLPLELARAMHPEDWGMFRSALDDGPFRQTVRLWGLGAWQRVRLSASKEDRLWQLDADTGAPEERSPAPTFAATAQAELLGGIVHSFNNQLSAMMGFAELALLDLPDTHPVYGQLETVLESGQAAVQFTQQLLQSAGRSVLDNRPLDLSALLRELTAANDLKLQCAEAALTITADETALRSALQHSLHLLRKLSAAAPLVTLAPLDVSPELAALLAVPPGAHAGILLQQAGVGFTPAQTAKLLQPYFLGKVSQQKKGLGFALLHGLVRQLGGAVLCHSEEDVGLGLLVLLPLVEAPEDREPDRSPDGVAPIWIAAHHAEWSQLIAHQLRGFGACPLVNPELVPELLRAGLRPALIVSSQLRDMPLLKNLALDNPPPILITTPFPEKISSTTAGLSVIRFDIEGRHLQQAVSGILS